LLIPGEKQSESHNGSQIVILLPEQHELVQFYGWVCTQRS